MTLSDFLLARIAEDEAEAWHVLGHDEAGRWYKPERVIAECEAKRWIVTYYAPGGKFDDVRLMKVLASVYAEHPDYRPEWRP